MKINYIIATWNGKRFDARVNPKYYEDVLKNHLKLLNEKKHNLSQITIMKPISGIDNNYYNIELSGNTKIIECKNEYQSYGQWLKASEKYVDLFDYFIFIEDDYIPVIDDFDNKLIEIYKEGTYLCSMTWGNGSIFHCGISNGIISSNTLKKIINKIDFREWFNKYEKNNVFAGKGTNFQIPFSRYFVENGIEILDYRDYYLVDYRNSRQILDYSKPSAKHKEKIFSPIQTRINEEVCAFEIINLDSALTHSQLRLKQRTKLYR